MDREDWGAAAERRPPAPPPPPPPHLSDILKTEKKKEKKKKKTTTTENAPRHPGGCGMRQNTPETVSFRAMPLSLRQVPTGLTITTQRWDDNVAVRRPELMLIGGHYWSDPHCITGSVLSNAVLNVTNFWMLVCFRVFSLLNDSGQFLLKCWLAALQKSRNENKGSKTQLNWPTLQFVLR